MAPFNYIATSKTILADLHTPVSVYLRLRDLYAQSALMECSDYHEQSNARSFIGINPLASVAVSHGYAVINYPDGTQLRRQLSEDFDTAQAIHALIDHIHVAGDDYFFFSSFPSSSNTLLFPYCVITLFMFSLSLLFFALTLT